MLINRTAVISILASALLVSGTFTHADTGGRTLDIGELHSLING